MYDNTEPVAGKTYADDWWQGWLDSKLTGVSDNDISLYLEDTGYNPESNEYADFSSTISDPKMTTDLLNARTAASKSGNTKLVNTLDLVFKYGEKAIAALVAAGVLDGPALAQSGYSNISQDADGTIKIGQTKTAVQSAPLPESSKFFGLDFSSPTVIIVTFIVVMLLAYFLFFNKPKSKR